MQTGARPRVSSKSNENGGCCERRVSLVLMALVSIIRRYLELSWCRAPRRQWHVALTSYPPIATFAATLAEKSAAGANDAQLWLQ